MKNLGRIVLGFSISAIFCVLWPTVSTNTLVILLLIGAVTAQQLKPHTLHSLAKALVVLAIAFLATDTDDITPASLHAQNAIHASGNPLVYDRSTGKVYPAKDTTELRHLRHERKGLLQEDREQFRKDVLARIKASQDALRGHD